MGLILNFGVSSSSFAYLSTEQSLSSVKTISINNAEQLHRVVTSYYGGRGINYMRPSGKEIKANNAKKEYTLRKATNDIKFFHNNLSEKEK